MYEPVWGQVVKGKYSRLPGRLQGYRRAALEGLTYPGAVVELGRFIDGVIYMNVEEEDLKRLDHFEGEWYQRTNTVIQTEQGRLNASFYRWTHDELTTDADWSVAGFEAGGLNVFLSTYLKEKL